MTRRTVLPLVLACALAGCSTDDSQTASETPTTRAPTAAPTVPTPTPTPTELAFGDAASVSWAPTSALTGTLSIRVESVREGDFADFAGLVGSGITKANQPYYVDAVIANEGDADLGGLDVPLYLADSNGTLSPPWGFGAPFEPCDSGPLPEPFGAGDEAELCLVFLGSPGSTMESVTFRPTLDTPPVTWTGELDPPTEDPVSKQRRKRR